MRYKFKALVIDDEVQIESLCNSYKKKLKFDYGIDIDFDVIINESNYDENKLYDILLVDYDLTKGYSQTLNGSDIIRKFREKNTVSKIIFYSSSFIYDPDNRNYSLDLYPKDIFELINDYGIDYIAYKNNFDMMIKVIKKSCDTTDILSQLLLRMFNEYEKEDIQISYKNADGKEIPLTSLINELLMDTEEGKRFRNQVTETILSTILEFKY